MSLVSCAIFASQGFQSHVASLQEIFGHFFSSVLSASHFNVPCMLLHTKNTPCLSFHRLCFPSERCTVYMAARKKNPFWSLVMSNEPRSDHCSMHFSAHDANSSSARPIKLSLLMANLSPFTASTEAFPHYHTCVKATFLGHPM